MVAWLDAALAGAPVVTTATGESPGTIQHEVTALVAADEASWGRHIERLVDDSRLRRRIAGAARRQALLHHGPHSTAHRLLDALEVAAGWVGAAGP